MPPRFPKAAFVIRSRACESAGALNVRLRSARGLTSAATGYFFFARFSSIAACAGARRATGTRSRNEVETACRRQPEGWSGSDINRSSPSRLHRPRPSRSKNAEGAEAFWTQAKPEPPGRAHQTGRANQTFDPIELPWQAIREWIPDDDAEPCADLFDQRPDSGKPVEIRRKDGSILVLDSD